MSITAKIRHLFIPHPGNNFRAKLLHNSSLFAIIALVVSFNVLFRLIDSTSLHILGFTSSITVDEVVRSTNGERISLGLESLSYSPTLADAAHRKAANMFSENYWAHNSPSGKSPWVWFKEAGYNYVYAGENLAKDFGSTDRMMQAWMASPTHKDNITNPKYSEIGIAVVPGSISDQDTVLVVQLFGARSGGAVPQAQDASSNQVAPQVAQIKGQETSVPQVVLPSLVPTSAPKYSRYSLTKSLNLATTILFILVLIIDLFIAESQRLSRRVGNNWAHIIFINFILLATTIVNAGRIM